jgi:hypothetical protein
MLKKLGDSYGCRIFHSYNFEDVQNKIILYIEDRLLEIVDVKFSTSYDGDTVHFSAMVIFKN